MKEIKLKLFILLAAFAYVVMVISSFDLDSFKRGFDDGYNGTRRELYHIKISPSEVYNAFTDSIQNTSSLDYERVALNEFIVEQEHVNAKEPVFYKIMKNVSMIMLLGLFFIFPFKLFRFITRSYQGKIFETKTINQLKHMGIIFVLLYFAELGYNLCSYKIQTTLFAFENYTIERSASEPLCLLFGLICIIVAMMMRKAVIIKKENEFTI